MNIHYIFQWTVAGLLLLALAWAAAGGRSSALAHAVGRRWPLLAILWVAAVTAEYWVFGSASYARLGDEANTSLAFHIYRHLSAGLDERFAAAIAGGSDGLAVFPFPVAFISIERLLFDLMPPWGALAVHKLMNASVAFAGGWLVARAFGASRGLAFAIAAFATVSNHFVVTVTLTTGLGYAAIPLAVWVFCLRLGQRFYLAAAFVFSALYAISSAPFHTGVPMAVAVAIAAAATGGWRRPAFYVVLLGWAALMALNWADVLYAMASFAPMSARLASFAPAITAKDIGYFVEFQKLAPALVVATVLSLAPLAASVRLRAVAVLVAPTALALAFDAVSWNSLGLGLLEGVQAIYVAYATPAMEILALAMAAPALGEPRVRRERMAVAVAVALPFALAAAYKVENLAYWLGLAGQRDLFEIPNLKDQRWRTGEGARDRVLAVPYRFTDNFLFAYGLDAAGGYFNLIDRWRVAQWEAMSPASAYRAASGQVALDYIRASCPPPPDLDRLLDTRLMRAANIGWIASKLPIAGRGLTQVSGPDPALWSNGCELALGPKLARYARERFDPSPVFIYRVDGVLPRIFFAGAVVHAPERWPGPAFWQAVADGVEGRAVALDPGTDVAAGPLPTARVFSWRRIMDGYEAEIDAPEGGLLTLNHTPVPFWRAAVDNGAASSPMAVSGMMIAVTVPPGARTVRFVYDRWLPSDILTGR